MKLSIALFVSFLFVTQGFSQVILGKVVSSQKSLPFVDVLVENTTIGTSTREDGTFRLAVPSDVTSDELRISSVGYQTKQIKIDLSLEVIDLGDIELQDDMLGLNEVVITGTMRETFVKASPIKVDVISVKHLTKNLPATNLMEGLQLVTGVQEVVACGVCYTNGISINGLPGPYTAVLMDGSPIYGNLAAVYGLNGIPTQMIDRIEIIKGPNSTLYGSEAIAGVINVITKKPEDQSTLAVDVMGTSHLESFGNVTVASKAGKWYQMSGLNYAYLNLYDDDNEDGFGDIVNMDRVSLFSKWSMKRENFKKFTIAGKYYYEDRRNGTQEFLANRAYRTLRGNDSIYGESILTKRMELFGTYELAMKENVRIDYSFSNHDQDSYYGAAHYMAAQRIGFANLVWTKQKGKHTVVSGFSNRYQFYDDNTVATELSGAQKQYIPGIFLEDEFALNPRLTVLGGMRVDQYSNHGLIPSPRLSTKVAIDEWTTWRLNFGTGVKIVNLFTEDHAFVSGQRAVEIAEKLDPEQSWNLSTNLNQTHSWWGTSGMIDLDVFYTRFSNKISPNYDDPNKIIYSNVNGFAESYGAAFNFSQQFKFPLAYRFGVNYNFTSLNERNDAGEMEASWLNFAPLWSGVVNINYAFKKHKLDIAYTASITGPMALPEVYDLDNQGNPVGMARSTKSKPFAFHNVQINKQFSQNKIEIYGGIQNLLNYKQQESPLVGYNDPSFAPGFSPFFDTSYSYAPVHGREIYIGLKMNLDYSSKN